MDNYNVYGLFAYFSIKQRQNLLNLNKESQILKEDSTQILASGNFSLSCPKSVRYAFEEMLPILLITMKSKSETIKALTLETTQFYAFML